MKWSRFTVLLAAAAACGGGAAPDDQPTGSIDSAAWREARTLPPAVQAQLDSGNAAFRDDDFERARRHYRAAAAAGPDQAAAWFGLYMAEARLGNTAAADSALRRARELSPGASLIHPTDSLPAGHP